MRKYLFCLIALSIAALGCVKEKTSPETDDGEEYLTPEEEAEAALYDAAAMMLSEFTCETVTPEQIIDRGSNTFEPKFGEVLDESNAFERTVIVDDADMAEAFFMGLVGWDDEILQETAGGYTLDFSAIGLGSLEFFRDGDGTNMGYATVDLPCMPHLEKIAYKTKEQAGLNAAAEYESPAEYGDVFLSGGRYYICVKPATGYSSESSGILVCVEAGKGSYWDIYLGKESWGCWKPKQSWTDPRYLVYFLKLCADPKFTQDKAQIIKKFPGKVFPNVERWLKYDSQQTLGDHTWGFGALVPGYSHVTRQFSNLGSEKSNSDYDKKNWGGRRVVIARDATEGDYKWKKARWERRFHHYCIPWVCKADKGIYADTKKYTGKGGWEDFFEDNDLIVYTMNAVAFYDTLPFGYTYMPIWDEEEEE